jgi:hypothetical protein
MIYAVSRAVACFLLSVLVSSILTRYGLRGLGRQGGAEEGTRITPPVEFLIRFFETALVFIFVIDREYTALAILIAADLLVRKQRIGEDPVNHLLGPLCSFTVATIFAVIARAWMSKYLAILIV